MLNNSSRLLISNFLPTALPLRQFVRGVSGSSFGSERKVVQNWRPKFNEETGIDRKFGKISAKGSSKGNSSGTTKMKLRYPIQDLLKQLPVLLHEGVKSYGKGRGDILVQTSASHSERTSRMMLWKELGTIVRKAADKFLEEKPVEQLKAEWTIRNPGSNEEEKEEAKKYLRRLAESREIKKINEKMERISRPTGRHSRLKRLP